MRTFGLDAMLFVVLLAAVTLAVGRGFPLFATALGFVSAVAVGRTGYLVQQFAACGIVLGRSRKLHLFADSAGLAAIALVGMGFGILVGAFIGGSGFVVVLSFCWPTAAASHGATWLSYGAVLGGLAGGGYVFLRVQRDLWRYQDAASEIEAARMDRPSQLIGGIGRKPAS